MDTQARPPQTPAPPLHWSHNLAAPAPPQRPLTPCAFRRDHTPAVVMSVGPPRQLPQGRPAQWMRALQHNSTKSCNSCGCWRSPADEQHPAILTECSLSATEPVSKSLGPAQSPKKAPFVFRYHSKHALCFMRAGTFRTRAAARCPLPEGVAAGTPQRASATRTSPLGVCNSHTSPRCSQISSTPHLFRRRG